MTSKRYVLRDLPGVAEFEAMLQRIAAHPNPLWAPEVDLIDDKIDELVENLFGIPPEPKEMTAEETLSFLNERARNLPDAHEGDMLYWDDDGEDDEEPEDHPEHRRLSQEELDALFDPWDVTDGKGNILGVFKYIAVTIVSVTLGYEGHLPDAQITDAEAERKAQSWGSKLEEEARRFRKR